MNRRFNSLLLALWVLAIPASHAQSLANNWHQWRGPDNNGVSRTAQPPLEWSEEKNLLWKAEIKGNGTGSPIVWGDKVFVTTAINTGKVDPSKPKPEQQPERVFGIKHPNTRYEMVVLCYDRKSGKRLWRKVAKTLVPHEGHHKDASFASASPFCDGERLYCWFGSAGLFAYSLDGQKIWERDLGRAKVGASLGEGSSPVVQDGKLVLVRDHAGQSAIEVLDAKNGKTLWKKERNEGNAWATPAITTHKGTTQVITTASRKVRSYNLDTGEITWEAEGLTGNCIPAPIVHEDVVYCMSGYQGFSLLAIPITGKGNVTDSVIWRANRGTPYVPSPILYDGRLYFTQSNQNILTCLDTKDGSQVIERTRLPGLGGLYSSPVGAAGKIYIVDRNGKTLVIEAGKKFKVLATNQLDDNFHASPALAGKQLFLRGMRFLYCLEDGGTFSGKAIGEESIEQKKDSPSPDPKKALSAQLKALVEAGKITGDESIELYLTAFPEEEENVKRWLAGQKAEGETRKLLAEIAKRKLPKDYPGGKGHQPFVDKWFANAPPGKGNEVARLWKEQRRLFPKMKNRGESFIRILDYVRSTGRVQPGGKAEAKQNPHIKRKVKAQIRHEPGKPHGKPGSISGQVKDSAGKEVGGVMVTAFDEARRQSVSVFTQPDGRFRIANLHVGNFSVRARLPGQRDQTVKGVKLGNHAIAFRMEPASGDELEAQRPANSAFAQLKFDSPRDKLNFKMMCSYCHQIGTPAFRAPEKPVDWETMIKRMDGFGGLYPHTKKTIIPRIIETYKDNPVDRWPEYVPPPAPNGMVTKAKITTWEMGEYFEGSFHDLEVGDDGLAYVVHIGKQYTATLDPKTGERIYYKLPRGSHGPHSIEPDNDGDMWLTLCVSGEMAKFDLETKEYTILSSAEPPAERGSWPHTLRIDPKDPEGYIWYTDAGRNSVFRLHPKTLERKEYHLLEAGQVKGGGKGESRGITPYGLDYSPVDGTIWYSKLNGNRVGRIDPKAPDGDVTEWNPPFRGPRRLHVAPDGIVWVPGFGSGVFGKFDPKTEKWTTYPLPDYLNQIPYALNVAPDGMVWICGTGNDTLYRFNPKTEYLIEFPLPHRVSYTREIEFGKDGSIWTSTSGPARHMENVCGTIVKLEILDGFNEEVGGMKISPIELSLEEQGVMTAEAQQAATAKLGALLAKIEARALPKEYHGESHQQYVDRIMATLTKDQRGHVGRLFNQRRKAQVGMENAGHSFVRILDYVAKGGRATEIPAEPGPGTLPPPKTSGNSIEEKTGIHRLENTRRTRFDAFVYVNRLPDKPREGETPRQFAGRIHGRLANQEGRVLLKLPPGMNRAAYNGFKTFLGSEGDLKTTNCAACHSPPDFAIPDGSTLLRRNWSEANFKAILHKKMAKATEGNPDYAGLKITEADIQNLFAFQQTLSRVNDKEFRQLILNARVVEVTAKPAPSQTSQNRKVSIPGMVSFEGKRPPRKRLHMDDASQKLYNGKLAFDEDVLIAGSGGLANVFVFVKNPPAGNYPIPGNPVVLDQQKSFFRPRVLGVRVGQEVVMKNGDPFIHNIRSLSRKNRPFNIVQPSGSPDREKIFKTAEGPITIKCDFHRWMTAHFWVMDHPFYAVTDVAGQFSIPGLPPGKYTFAAWHEVFGEQEIQLTVRQGSSPKPVFTFRQDQD
jgi:outer membrane protein assembly factor BamB